MTTSEEVVVVVEVVVVTAAAALEVAIGVVEAALVVSFIGSEWMIKH